MPGFVTLAYIDFLHHEKNEGTRKENGGEVGHGPQPTLWGCDSNDRK